MPIRRIDEGSPDLADLEDNIRALIESFEDNHPDLEVTEICMTRIGYLGELRARLVGMQVYVDEV